MRERDGRLITRFLNGDNEAFKQLWLRHRCHVRSVIARTTSTYCWLDDIEQNVALKLFRKIHLYKGRSSFTTWLHAVVRNEVLMYARKEMIRIQPLCDIDTLPEIICSSNLENRIAAREELKLIEKHIKKRMRKKSAAIMFLRLQGFGDKEAAAAIGATLGSVKSAYHRGTCEQRKLTRCDYSSVCGDSGGDDLLGSARVA